ncbi:RNA polymerase sigma factor [Caulobacter sp. NIBR2454]|uniref:RNA polymerase sigma factor n=1 Tax=Caulobacter sp. NIBR2454 TaxID=3015996 RepID=UPI0022B6BB50|nr:RNA polymerase sigma factor [Caulobacter sp. NIBR2454]
MHPLPVDPTADTAEGASVLALYERHGRWLRRVLRTKVAPDFLDEVVQETFRRLVSRAHSPIRHPKAFLLRVALSAVLAGKAKSKGVIVDVPAEFARAEPACQIEALALKQVILAMPKALQETFVLSRIVGLTYKEIAEHQGISVKTVEWRLSKALELCRELLAD